jgi:hypothetical protein
MNPKEIKKKAVCKCAECGEEIEFCAKDNPLPSLRMYCVHGGVQRGGNIFIVK